MTFPGREPGPAAEATAFRRTRRDHPLLIVNTGHGKGKSTAAFGLALRAWNQGWPVGVFQFVKSAKWRVGEERALRLLGETGQGGAVSWNKMGEGWSWIQRDADTLVWYALRQVNQSPERRVRAL